MIRSIPYHKYLSLWVGILAEAPLAGLEVCFGSLSVWKHISLSYFNDFQQDSSPCCGWVIQGLFLYWSQSSVGLAAYCGSLSCGNIKGNHYPHRFPVFGFILCLLYSYKSPSLLKVSVDRLMLPPLGFTAGMMLHGWWAVLAFCQI